MVLASHSINLQSKSVVWMGEQNVKDLQHHPKPPSGSELHLGTTSLDLGSAFKTMSMNEAKDIDGFPITFTGQAYNHHSKPSLNQLYALPRELSTWFVLGFWPPLRWYSEHRWLMTCKTLKLTSTRCSLASQIQGCKLPQNRGKDQHQPYLKATRMLLDASCSLVTTSGSLHHWWVANTCHGNPSYPQVWDAWSTFDVPNYARPQPGKHRIFVVEKVQTHSLWHQFSVWITIIATWKTQHLLATN